MNIFINYIESLVKMTQKSERSLLNEIFDGGKSSLPALSIFSKKDSCSNANSMLFNSTYDHTGGKQHCTHAQVISHIDLELDVLSWHHLNHRYKGLYKADWQKFEADFLPLILPLTSLAYTFLCSWTIFLRKHKPIDKILDLMHNLVIIIRYDTLIFHVFLHFSLSAACNVSFENLDYSVLTDKCKGPQYPAKSCCDAFKEFACPFSDAINDLETDCASTMFSYINLYGKYPPGLFANECREDKNGLDCQNVEQSKKSGVQIAATQSSLLTLTAGLIVLLLQLF